MSQRGAATELNEKPFTATVRSNELLTFRNYFLSLNRKFFKGKDSLEDALAITSTDKIPYLMGVEVKGYNHTVFKLKNGRITASKQIDSRLIEVCGSEAVVGITEFLVETYGFAIDLIVIIQQSPKTPPPAS